MSKISVTTIAGLTSGGDANKVKIESGDTLQVESNATVGGTLGVTGASTLTGALTANGGATVLGNTIVNPDTAGKSTFQFTTQAANDAKLIMKSDTTEKVTIHANGTTVLNGGSVTMPSQPSFMATGNNSAWVNVSAGNTDIVEFDATPIHNVGSHYSTANDRFVAPIAGTYLFGYHMYVRNNNGNPTDSTSNYGYVRLKKNGSNVSNHDSIFGYYNHGDGDHRIAGAFVMVLAANDYIQVALQAVGATVSHYGNSSLFYGYLLG